MLEPTARHLFTDGLRPPTGYSVDLAVGTTYSLGLASLLLPPLAMAAHDRESSEEDADGSIALLEAVRRFADRLTVFCQAGAIHIPGTYRRILTFAENTLVEVTPGVAGRIFHPKLWALRFTDGEHYRHRLLCMSRNLTADTSWDTILQLEETDGTRGITGAPAADFIDTLPSLATRTLAPSRAQQLADLASSLRDAQFAVPEPYTSGELWPLGIDSPQSWPIPHNAWNAVVISPFLDRTTVAKVRPSGRRVFVSRAETYAELGRDAFTGADVRVLDPLAETTPDEGQEDPSAPWEVRSGLHAKTFIWDYDGSGWCLTGSANATGAAFGGNVEFSVLLRGPVRRCGVEAFLPTQPTKGELSLARVLMPHTIEDAAAKGDPTRAVEMDVATYYSALAGAGPELRVTPAEAESRFDVQLAFSGSPPSSPGHTTVRLLSRAGDANAHHLSEDPTWSDVGLSDLTPFLAVSTTVDVEDLAKPITIGCVLKAELLGAPDDRPARLLRSLLDSEESVLRYLSFLLDESGSDAWGLGLSDVEVERTDGPPSPTRPTFDDIALLETLLRAAARGDEARTRVHALLRDLRDDDERSDVVSEDFLAVWEAVWAAVSVDDSTKQGTDR
jgi:hypothetical protein